ncbi:MAG: hypothetical protein Q9160_009172 [Pyrenula sp. 1 TL-2023]
MASPNDFDRLLESLQHDELDNLPFAELAGLSDCELPGLSDYEPLRLSEYDLPTQQVPSSNPLAGDLGDDQRFPSPSPYHHNAEQSISPGPCSCSARVSEIEEQMIGYKSDLAIARQETDNGIEMKLRYLRTRGIGCVRGIWNLDEIHRWMTLKLGPQRVVVLTQVTAEVAEVIGPNAIERINNQWVDSFTTINEQD